MAIKSGFDFMLDITIDFEAHLSAIVAYKEYIKMIIRYREDKVQKTFFKVMWTIKMCTIFDMDESKHTKTNSTETGNARENYKG